MLERVDITNSRGSTFTLMLEEDDGPYQVNDIEGLDPVKATLVATSYAGADGENFQSAKRPARNIKYKLDLDPDFNPKDYSDLRNDLYKYFMPKSKIAQRFFLSSGLYLDIDGIVEDVSSPLFEEDPNVEVSVMCYQPDFIDGRIVSLSGHTVSDSTNTVIDYPGNIESGVVVTLNINRTVGELSIYNSDEGGGQQQLDFSGSLLNGDSLVISSLRGAKGITLTRASVSSSYLYGRSPQSSWIELVEGLNQFRIHADGDPIPYTVEYVVRYGGL